jgi:hypothetical protein
MQATERVEMRSFRASAVSFWPCSEMLSSARVSYTLRKMVIGCAQPLNPFRPLEPEVAICELGPQSQFVD